MNLNGIQKHYDKLSDAERFYAVIDAELRKDYSEARRLNDTARRATYRQIAYPYSSMRETLIDCGMTAALEILQAGTFLAWRWGTYLARDLTDWKKGDEAEAYSQLQEMAAQVMANWEALPLFAEDIGLELEHVLYFLPARAQIDLTVTMAQEVRAIEENTMQWAIDRTEDPAEREAIRTERAERLAKRRHKAAREVADGLKELWDKLQS
jgi:hypothetical protein